MKLSSVSLGEGQATISMSSLEINRISSALGECAIAFSEKDYPSVVGERVEYLWELERDLGRAWSAIPPEHQEK